MSRIAELRQIVNGDHDSHLIDGFWVDPTTASMLILIYDALDSDEARNKFERLPLMRLVDFGWKHVRAA